MELVYTLLVLLAILNIVLGIGLRNLMKQNEELEDTLIDVVEGTRVKVENALQRMRDIDNREVFEKDDEVGATFQELKNIIEELDEEL
jgi:predicted  nucleic acid-binding Zn-ribbon protein